MSKKQLIAYILAGLLAIYLIHLYRAWRSEPGASKVAAPSTPNVGGATTTPAAPAVSKEHLQTVGTQPTNPANVSNEDLIKQYSDKIIAAKGIDADAFFQRGLVYQNMQQYRLAIQDFNAALKIMPNSPNALYNKALCEQQENMDKDAISDLDQAIKIKPDFADAYNLRASIYANSGLFNKALNDYQNAIKLSPNFDQAYFNLGVLYEQQKQYKDAIAMYDKAISVNQLPPNPTPEDAANAKQRILEVYMHRAIAKMLLPDLNAALQDATYVINNDPNNVAAYKLRADIYKYMGNSAQSNADNAKADTLTMQNMLQNNK